MIVQASFHTPCKSELARLFNIPRTTIGSILKKFHHEENVENKPRSGRRKLFSVRDKNAVVRLVKQNRKRTLDDITNNFNEGKDRTFSRKTVMRKLHEEGFQRRAVRKLMVVRDVNRKKRVRWCKERKNWTVDNEWKKIIFSDESQIIIGTNNRVYIWRKNSEMNSPHLVCPPSQRKVTLMVWGCMCINGVGTLVAVNGNINAQKYIDILDNNLWPVIARHFPDNSYIFMDDNAPVHRARLVSAYMQDNDINTTEWPAQSPDINVIENIWLRLKRDLKNVSRNIQTPDQLFAEIHRLWQNIPVEYVRGLYESIPSRIKEVIRMKGNLTKY